ncbi:Zinc-binding dehydrogenase, partial [Aspergillus sclerotialis]
TVVQVGNEVSKWKVGDRVGVLNFKNACSKCPSCLSTFKRYGSLDPRYCENREAGGFMTDGAFAEYMVADSATTVTLPPGISFEQGAPLLCAGATVWGALQKAIPSLQPDDTIGIIGIGGLGQLGVQFSKALNYRTVAMDNHEPSLDLTVDLPSDLQPDLRVNSADADAADRIHAYTRGEGLAAVIVCTDSIAVNKWALGLLRVGGVLVPLGLPVENWEFDSRLLLFRELVIRGSYVASKGEVEEMVELVEKREIKSMVTVVQKGDIPRLPERYMSREFRGRLVVTF